MTSRGWSMTPSTSREGESPTPFFNSPDTRAETGMFSEFEIKDESFEKKARKKKKEKKVPEVILFSPSYESFKREGRISWILNNLNRNVIETPYPNPFNKLDSIQLIRVEKVMHNSILHPIETLDNKILKDFHLPQNKKNRVVEKLVLDQNSCLKVVYKKYSIAFSLDVTPSMVVLDPFEGEILLDRVVPALGRMLKTIIEPVVIGNHKFVPEILLSVVAVGGVFRPMHSIFQNLIVNKSNFDFIMLKVKKRMKEIEELESKQLKKFKSNSKNFVNIQFSAILENSMVAFDFLPKDGAPVLIIITDGVYSISNLKSENKLRITGSDMKLVVVNVSRESKSKGDFLFCHIPSPDFSKFLGRMGGTIVQYTFLKNLELKEKSIKKDKTIALLHETIFMKLTLLRVFEKERKTFVSLFIEQMPGQDYHDNLILKNYKIKGLELKPFLEVRAREGFRIKQVVFYDRSNTIKTMTLRLCFWPNIDLEYIMEVDRENEEISMLLRTVSSQTFNQMHEEFCKQRKYRKEEIKFGDVTVLSKNLEMLVKRIWLEDHSVIALKKLCIAKGIKNKKIPNYLARNLKKKKCPFFLNEVIISMEVPGSKRHVDFNPYTLFKVKTGLNDFIRNNWGKTKKIVEKNLGCEKLFENHYIMFLKTKENVFKKDRQGICIIRMKSVSEKIFEMKLRFFQTDVKKKSDAVKRIKSEFIKYGFKSVKYTIERSLQSLPKTQKDHEDYSRVRFSELPFYSSYLAHRKWTWNLKEHEDILMNVLNCLFFQRKREGFKVVCSSPSTIFIKTFHLNAFGKRHEFFFFYSIHCLKQEKCIITEYWLEPAFGTVTIEEKKIVKKLVKSNESNEDVKDVKKQKFVEKVFTEKVKVDIDEEDITNIISETFEVVDKEIISYFLTFERIFKEAIGNKNKRANFVGDNDQSNTRSTFSMSITTFINLIDNYEGLWNTGVKKKIIFPVFDRKKEELYDRLVDYVCVLNDCEFPYWGKEESNARFFARSFELEEKKLFFTVIHPVDVNGILVEVCECSFGNLGHIDPKLFPKRCEIIFNTKSDFRKNERVSDETVRYVDFLKNLHDNSFSFAIYMDLQENNKIDLDTFKKGINNCVEYGDDIKISELFEALSLKKKKKKEEVVEFPYCFIHDSSFPKNKKDTCFEYILEKKGYCRVEGTPFHFFFKIPEKYKYIDTKDSGFKKSVSLLELSEAKSGKKDEQIGITRSESHLPISTEFNVDMEVYMEDNSQISDTLGSPELNRKEMSSDNSNSHFFVRFEIEVENETREKIQVTNIPIKKIQEIIGRKKNEINNNVSLKFIILTKDPNLNLDIFDLSDVRLDKDGNDLTKAKFLELLDDFSADKFFFFRSQYEFKKQSREDLMLDQQYLDDDDDPENHEEFRHRQLSIQLLPKRIHFVAKELKKKIQAIVSRDILYNLLDQTIEVNERVLEVVERNLGKVEKLNIEQSEMGFYLLESSSIKHFSEQITNPKITKKFVFKLVKENHYVLFLKEYERNPYYLYEEKLEKKKKNLKKKNKEEYRVVRPYWILVVVNISQEKVFLTFWTPFKCSTSQKNKLKDQIKSEIAAVQKKINTTVLLKDLYVTKFCSSLLLASTREDKKVITLNKTVEESKYDKLIGNIYKVDQFKIQMPVEEIKFFIDSRLRINEFTKKLKQMFVSRGFLVQNRANLYTLAAGKMEVFFFEIFVDETEEKTTKQFSKYSYSLSTVGNELLKQIKEETVMKEKNRKKQIEKAQNERGRPSGKKEVSKSVWNKDKGGRKGSSKKRGDKGGRKSSKKRSLIKKKKVSKDNKENSIGKNYFVTFKIYGVEAIPNQTLKQFKSGVERFIKKERNSFLSQALSRRCKLSLSDVSFLRPFDERPSVATCISLPTHVILGNPWFFLMNFRANLLEYLSELSLFGYQSGNWGSNIEDNVSSLHFRFNPIDFSFLYTHFELHPQTQRFGINNNNNGSSTTNGKKKSNKMKEEIQKKVGVGIAFIHISFLNNGKIVKNFRKRGYKKETKLIFEWDDSLVKEGSDIKIKFDKEKHPIQLEEVEEISDKKEKEKFELLVEIWIQDDRISTKDLIKSISMTVNNSLYDYVLEKLFYQTPLVPERIDGFLTPLKKIFHRAELNNSPSCFTMKFHPVFIPKWEILEYTAKLWRLIYRTEKLLNPKLFVCSDVDPTYIECDEKYMKNEQYKEQKILENKTYVLVGGKFHGSFPRSFSKMAKIQSLVSENTPTTKYNYCKNLVVLITISELGVSSYVYNLKNYFYNGAGESLIKIMKKLLVRIDFKIQSLNTILRQKMGLFYTTNEKQKLSFHKILSLCKQNYKTSRQIRVPKHISNEKEKEKLIQANLKNIHSSPQLSRSSFNSSTTSNNVSINKKKEKTTVSIKKKEEERRKKKKNNFEKKKKGKGMYKGSNNVSKKKRDGDIRRLLENKYFRVLPRVAKGRYGKNPLNFNILETNNVVTYSQRKQAKLKRFRQVCSNLVSLANAKTPSVSSKSLRSLRGFALLKERARIFHLCRFPLFFTPFRKILWNLDFLKEKLNINSEVESIEKGNNTEKNGSKNEKKRSFVKLANPEGNMEVLNEIGNFIFIFEEFFKVFSSYLNRQSKTEFLYETKEKSNVTHETLQPLIEINKKIYPIMKVGSAMFLQMFHGKCFVIEVFFKTIYVCVNMYTFEPDYNLLPNGDTLRNEAEMNNTKFFKRINGIREDLHLNSFVYDFHLKILFDFISSGNIKVKSMNVSDYIYDFNRYYSKAIPKFRYNMLAHRDVLCEIIIPKHLGRDHFFKYFCEDVNKFAKEMKGLDDRVVKIKTPEKSYVGFLCMNKTTVSSVEKNEKERKLNKQEVDLDMLYKEKTVTISIKVCFIYLKEHSSTKYCTVRWNSILKSTQQRVREIVKKMQPNYRLNTLWDEIYETANVSCFEKLFKTCYKKRLEEIDPKVNFFISASSIIPWLAVMDELTDKYKDDSVSFKSSDNLRKYLVVRTQLNNTIRVTLEMQLRKNKIRIWIFKRYKEITRDNLELSDCKFINEVINNINFIVWKLLHDYD